MDIVDWRKKIDDIDRRLVELLSERARRGGDRAFEAGYELADLRARAGARCIRECAGDQ